MIFFLEKAPAVIDPKDLTCFFRLHFFFDQMFGRKNCLKRIFHSGRLFI